MIPRHVLEDRLAAAQDAEERAQAALLRAIARAPGVRGFAAAAGRARGQAATYAYELLCLAEQGSPAVLASRLAFAAAVARREHAAAALRGAEEAAGDLVSGVWPVARPAAVRRSA